MKILRIIYDWPPPWQGLAPHPYELTVAQTKRGHTFDIFCGRWPKAGPIEEPTGVTCHPIIRAPLGGTMLLTSAVILFFKYIFWRDEPKNWVDIIHIHGHFGIWIYFYRSLLKKIYPGSLELKTPLVVHFHNTVIGRWNAAKENEVNIKPISKYLDWPLAVFSDRLAVKVADACIFVSEGTREEAIQHYGADPSKCYVVESGVNTDMFKGIGQEEFEKTRRDLGLDPSEKIVLNQGAMVERKNIHVLVEAMKFLPENYKLLLVGTGDSAYMLKILETIKLNGLEGRVIQAGYTPYPLAPISFQAADIFVLPSSFEGFPKVVSQSLAVGVPALVSGFKAGEDIKGLYYLTEVTSQAVADQIKQIVESPLAKEVNVSYVQKHFSWDNKAIQVDSVYSKVLVPAPNLL